MSMFVYIYVCMYIYVCIYMYIYVYIYACGFFLPVASRSERVHRRLLVLLDKYGYYLYIYICVYIDM